MSNKLDQVLPPSLFNKCKFISVGATGWVFEVAPGIAIKYLCTGRENELRHEYEMYELLERSNSPPHFIQSFLRLPYAHFMQRMPDCLDLRLQSNRRQDPKTHRFLEVLRLEPTAKVEQWTAELSAALAWLEGRGLVQGDLRPANILIDDEDHLRLADFDSWARFGDRDPGLAPPWYSRSNEFYGVGSELFAFGSILYNMTQGRELYEDKGPEVFQLFRDRVFPELTDSPLDVLTLRCWRAEFATLAELAAHCAMFEGAKLAATASVVDDEYTRRMKETCEQLLRTKLADLGKELPQDVREGNITRKLA